MNLKQIVELYETRTKAARTLGFTLQTFRNWEKKGIPLRSQQIIQYLTSGVLKVGNGK